MRDIETHLVTYNSEDVFYTSSKLLHMFAAYSDIPSTQHWTRSFPQLKEVIEECQPTNIIWRGEGIDLFFSGMENPRRKIEMDEKNEMKVVFRTPEPYFSIREDASKLLPSERNHYHAVMDSISEEMAEIYKMKIDKNPTIITFPQELYAREILVATARDLSYLQSDN